MRSLLQGVNHVVVLERDPLDVARIDAALRDSEFDVTVSTIGTIAECSPEDLAGADCILVSLDLPDGGGLAGLRYVLDHAGSAPVIALTGHWDRESGIESVRQGANDYLVKSELNGGLLARSIRYAIERRQAEHTSRQLLRAEMMRAGNLRLERGLLPRPLIEDPTVTWATRYIAGRSSGVLGGDFLDAVEHPDGSIRVVVGDVCGHGPDEAALGVCLRIAWRTMVLNGTPDAELLPALERVLEAERHDDLFCTACDLTIAPDRRSVTYRIAGHPPPLLLTDRAAPVPSEHRGMPLGLPFEARWPSATVELPPSWGLLNYTDGLIEPRAGHDQDADPLGIEGLVALVESHLPDQLGPEALHELMRVVEGPHARANHDDDLAVIGLLHTPATTDEG